MKTLAGHLKGLDTYFSFDRLLFLHLRYNASENRIDIDFRPEKADKGLTATPGIGLISSIVFAIQRCNYT